MPSAMPPASHNQQTTTDTTNTEESACTKVFRIVELMEGVILELPPREVLLAQRVCKAWKATIEDSSQLQQALLFKPLATTQPVHYEPGPDHWATHDSPKSKKLVFESPLLSSSMTDSPLLRGSGLQEASWRRQLITQPPLEKCQVIHHTLTHHEVTDLVAQARPGGVMMGEITGQMEASEWYRGGLVVDGWRGWRSCLDAWVTMSARKFLEFLIRSMEEEN